MSLCLGLLLGCGSEERDPDPTVTGEPAPTRTPLLGMPPTVLETPPESPTPTPLPTPTSRGASYATAGPKLAMPLGSELRSVRRDGSRFVILFSVKQVSYLARMDADGVLDPAFGEGGLRELPEDCAGGYVEVLGDGRILAIGHAAGGDDVVCRFRADGRADDSP